MYELIMGLNNKYFFVTLPNLNLEQRLYDDYRADESSWTNFRMAKNTIITLLNRMIDKDAVAFIQEDKAKRLTKGVSTWMQSFGETEFQAGQISLQE